MVGEFYSIQEKGKFMKEFVRRIFVGKNAGSVLLVIFGIFALMVLGCGGGSSKPAKPIPSEYWGDWKGQDGSTLSIRGDGSGDYRAGTFHVTNGSVVIDDEKNELSVSFFGIGKTLKIDQAPKGNEMKLGGVKFTKNGGSTSTTDSSDTDSTSDSSNSTSSTPSANGSKGAP